MSKKIKVAGYAKKEVYNGIIEYRNFSPDLVGQQLTSNGGTPLFTMGNFSITTNMDPTIEKKYITSKFSDFYSLEGLGTDTIQAESLILDNAGAFLNLDKRLLKNYALFGSLTEYIRVNLEDIITKWPASLSVSQFFTDINGNSVSLNTFENKSFNPFEDTTTFYVNTNLITNKFEINFLKNGTIEDSFNQNNNLRDLTTNFKNYSIFFDNTEYEIIDFIGSDDLNNDFITITVRGRIFGTGIVGKTAYHIKPTSINNDLFFNQLNSFSSYLLNRKSYPKYRSYFRIPKITDSGIIVYTDEVLTWPVTDGYNIDFDTSEYVQYVGKLLEIAEENDLTSSNLVNRFLVSDSISDFDTSPIYLDESLQDTSGQKMNKTLQIYGVNFDEINNFINGVAFANTVSYDKENNTPDVFVKNLASVMGWDLITAIKDNDLLTNYVKTSETNFKGESVGLTAVEADVELWRRIVLNSPWIWKSKGTRKTIEFLLNFIGTPSGLVDFNEYVYVANKPIDIDIFKKLLRLNNLDDNLNNYPIDYDGYPQFFKNTDDLHFQSDGLWYRETGGPNAIIDILTGNNPHVGPYDGGSRYINQLKTLIPNFKPVVITGETITTTATNLFSNYNLGQMGGYRGNMYVDVTNEDGSDLSSCVVVKTDIIIDPIPMDELDACGCPQDITDEALSICIKKLKKGVVRKPCDTLATAPVVDTDTGYYIFQHKQYNQDGTIFIINNSPVNRKTKFIDRECCKFIGGNSEFYEELDIETTEIVSGYACCSTRKCGPKEVAGCTLTCGWLLNKPFHFKNEIDLYLSFYLPDGSLKLVMPDATTCPSGWGVPVENITDPYDGEVGIGCKMTDYGVQNFDTLSNLFQIRARKNDCCNLDWPIMGKSGPTLRKNIKNE